MSATRAADDTCPTCRQVRCYASCPGPGNRERQERDAVALADFRVVDEQPQANIPEGHPRTTSIVNRECGSTWQCDFCLGLASSPKPVLPKGWQLFFSRRDPWWGEIHLVRCASCVGHGIERCLG